MAASQLDLFADRVLAWKLAPRAGLADQRHQRRTLPILIRERAPALEGNAHDAEIAGRDGVGVNGRSLGIVTQPPVLYVEAPAIESA